MTATLSRFRYSITLLIRYSRLIPQEKHFFIGRINRSNIDAKTRECNFVSVHNMKECRDIINIDPLIVSISPRSRSGRA